jgi:hypothetical protein
MKLLLVAFAIMVSFALGAAGCGGATGGTEAGATQGPSGPGGSASMIDTSRTAFAPPERDKDNDDDIGAPNDDINNNSVERYGHAASATDERAVTVLVKSYYAMAATGNGVKACTLLDSSLAANVPEDYGQAPGPIYLRGGKTCPAVMVNLFRHSRTQLAAKAATLEVRGVRVRGDHGFALLSFGRTPERDITVRRDHHRWKIGMLLDEELP